MADRDHLPGVPDRIITADTTADATVEQIMRDTGKRGLAEPTREVGSRSHNLDIGWLDSPHAGGG